MLLIASVAARAQWTSTGIFNASDFAEWSLPTGISPANGMLQWPSGSICQVQSAGYAFTAVKVGRPIRIVDGIRTETVIPTAVTITASTCTVAATMAFTHSSYAVTSGTAGLQEAIDYSIQTANQGGSVVALTPSWSWMGGQTSMIGAATGQNGTAILDERAGAMCSYAWNGSTYQPATCFPSLGNNTAFQSYNSSGSAGTVLTATAANELRFGDVSNKFATESYWYAGNTFETVNGQGVTFTLPVQLASLSLNGSVNLTGAQGNGTSVQTYSTGAAVAPLCAAADGSATTTGCTNGSVISLTTTGTSGPATLNNGVLNIPQYTGGSGGSVNYTTPTLNFMPLVSATGVTTTLVNSTISDNVAGGQASVGDAWTMNNSATLAAQGTATSGQNYPCNPLSLGLSYYNAGTVSDAYTLGCFVNPGSAPTTLVTLYGPGTLPAATASNSVGFLLAQNASIAATVGLNVNSPKFKLRGYGWTGTASQNLDWNMQAIQGTGANPSTTLTFSYTGTTGVGAVSAPSFVVPSGNGSTPGIALTPDVFSSYPACPGNEGREEAVKDSTTSTWGATVTGGGTFHIKMYCDGTNWTVEAK
jgi:hypothetical protein